MQNRKTGFRIGGSDDDDTQIPFIRSQRQSMGKSPGNQRTDKKLLNRLSRRITLISVLLPCLLAAILFFGYQHMKRQFAEAYSAEITRVQALSKELETKLAELSGQYEAMEKSFAEKQEPMNELFLVFEKTTSALKENLERIDGKLQAVEAAKADKTALEDAKKALAEEAAGFSKALPPLQETLQKLEAQVGSLDEKFTGQLTELGQSLENSATDLSGLKEGMAGLQGELGQMRTDTIEVLSSTVDRKSLNAAVKSQTRSYQQQISSLSKSLEEKDKTIRSLQRKMRSLEKYVKSLSVRKTPLGTPKPGTVFEQDIQ